MSRGWGVVGGVGGGWPPPLGDGHRSGADQHRGRGPPMRWSVWDGARRLPIAGSSPPPRRTVLVAPQALDQLLLRVDAELLVDRGEVVADGVWAQEHGPGDRRDAVTPQEAGDDLPLTR